MNDTTLTFTPEMERRSVTGFQLAEHPKPVTERRAISMLPGDRAFMATPIGEERAGVGGHLALVLATIGFLFLHPPLSAQTPPTNHSSDRYLFIVDTSSGMRLRSTAAQKAVNSLLLSGLNAQLQKGDSIGVWTYNEKLRAGFLPVQYWTPETEQVVASNVVSFLKGERFEKSPRFAVVLPELQPLVKESERLTVLLISDGSEPIAGTPYDANINAFFEENGWKQKQKRMPFITVLRSYRGEYVGATLNLAPWPVTFPAFPPKPKVAATPKPKAPEPTAKPAPPPPTTPPLIVIGKKSEPEPTPTPAPTEVAPTTQSQTGDTPTATAPEKPANPAQSAEHPVATAKSPEPTPNSVPTAGAHEPAPSPPATAGRPGPSQPGMMETPPAASPAQVATSTPPENLSKPKTVLIICVVLLILVVALLLVAQRRTRIATGTSLITRSMDKDGK